MTTCITVKKKKKKKERTFTSQGKNLHNFSRNRDHYYSFGVINDINANTSRISYIN